MEGLRHSDVSKLQRLFRRVGFRGYALALPLSFSVFSALMGAMGIAMLFPLVSGVVQQDYSGFTSSQFFRLLNLVFPLPKEDHKFLFLLVLGILLTCMLLKNVFGYLASIIESRILVRLKTQLKVHIFERYLSFGKQYFDSLSAGHVTARIEKFSNDLTVFLNVIHESAQALTMAMFLLAFLMLISWQLSLLCVVILPIFYVISQTSARHIRELSKQLVRKQSETEARVVGVMQRIPLIKTHNMELGETQQFQIAVEEASFAEMRAARLNKLVPFLNDLLAILAISSILAATTVFADDRWTSVQAGRLILFFFILKLMIPEILRLSSARLRLSAIAGQQLAIEQLFEDQDKFLIPDGKKSLDTFEKCIEVRNLSFAYEPGKDILENLSFSIPKGQVTALSGPSGVGKSTFANLLLRLYDVPENAIFIDGVDICQFHIRSLRSAISYVSQETYLLNGTVRQNILYGMAEEGDDHQLASRLQKAIEAASLAPVIAKLSHGLETSMGEAGAKLSGGERQRVALCRAFMRSSPIIILDEPTSAVDGMTEDQIKKAITAMHDHTFLLITHSESLLEVARHRVFLSDGNGQQHSA